MHTPPLKSHTIYVTNTLTPSASPPHKLRSSLTTLPSVTSSTSFSSPSYPSLKTSSFAHSAGRSDVFSRQNSGSRRSVRWLDGSGQVKDSGYSNKRTVDPAKAWARYTQTVRPQFKLHEPGRGGRVNGRGKNGRGGKADEAEEDGRFAVKLSLPCPSHSSCCFCVYSRQLGPVRVYFSHFARPKLQTGGRLPRGNNTKGAAVIKHAADHVPRGALRLEEDESKRVLLKERWMTCSAPSGEVIVPDLPPHTAEASHRYGRTHNTTPGELLGASKTTPFNNGFRTARNLHGKATSRPRHWLRNSAPPEHSRLDPILLKDPFRKTLPRSITFVNEDINTRIPGSWPGEEPALRVPRNSPRSRGPSSVPVKVGPVGGRDRRGMEEVFLHDVKVRGPPSFPRRAPPYPVKLLPKC